MYVDGNLYMLMVIYTAASMIVIPITDEQRRIFFSLT